MGEAPLELCAMQAKLCLCNVMVRNLNMNLRIKSLKERINATLSCRKGKICTDVQVKSSSVFSLSLIF